MWGVTPRFLCRSHLLGEHREMHQEVGTLRNHPHGRAVVEGHARAGQVDTRLLQERHDALVAEMERRGYSHESPMDYTDELALGSIDVAANRQELAARCDACRERLHEAGVL